MKKSKDLGKMNEGKEFKKKTIIKHDFYESFGNPIANKYHEHLFFKVFKTKSKQLNLIKTNDDGIKYYDIYDTCFTKKELIKEYDYFKNKEYKEIQTNVLKKFTPEDLKYWREEIPKNLKVKQKTL